MNEQPNEHRKGRMDNQKDENYTPLDINAGGGGGGITSVDIDI